MPLAAKVNSLKQTISHQILNDRDTLPVCDVISCGELIYNSTQSTLLLCLTSQGLWIFFKLFRTCVQFILCTRKVLSIVHVRPTIYILYHKVLLKGTQISKKYFCLVRKTIMDLYTEL